MDEPSETVAISWHLPQSYQSGSASVTIIDITEGVELSANPNTTSELGGPPGMYHLKPATSSYTFQSGVTIHWEIKIPDSENTANLAMFAADYTVHDEAPLLTFGAVTPQQVVVSNARPVGGENDFVLTVTARDDDELEGDEILETRVFVPRLIPAGDINDDSLARTDFAEITITEDYADGIVEKDEETGCSCTCTTCVDDIKIDLKPVSGTLSATTADGIVMITWERVVVRFASRSFTARGVVDTIQRCFREW